MKKSQISGNISRDHLALRRYSNQCCITQVLRSTT